jgi:hypothetical protein
MTRPSVAPYVLPLVHEGPVLHARIPSQAYFPVPGAQGPAESARAPSAFLSRHGRHRPSDAWEACPLFSTST